MIIIFNYKNTISLARRQRVAVRTCLRAFGGLLLLGLSSGLWHTIDAQQSNQQRAGRRVLATSSLAAKEYGEGVSNGVIVAEEEVEETRLFLGEALRSAEGLSGQLREDAVTIVRSMVSLVGVLGDPDHLRLLAESLDVVLSASISGLNESIPAMRPDADTGARVYAVACANCHGETGRGDGLGSAGLNPPPSDFTDAVALANQSPLDFYRKALIGVSGTAMPPFEGTLTESEIWAAVWHATSLRYPDSAVTAGAETLGRACVGCADRNRALPFPAYLPLYLTDPEQIARLTDEELARYVHESDQLIQTRFDSADVYGIVGYLRTHPFAEAHDTGVGETFALVRTEVIRGLRLAQNGASEEALAKVIDAYAAFEAVESEVSVRDRRLVSKIELAFSSLRSNVTNGSSETQLGASYQSLDGLLDQSQAVLAQRTSHAGFFAQSFLLLLREGVEALLIVGALAALVVHAGAPRTKRAIWWGVGAALGASVVTAILIETIFRIGIAQQELLEGATMLVAASVLLFVSYWLISKVEVRRWKNFLANQGTRAIKQGSLFALASASFLAVYREGFETILFYKALIITAESSGLGAIGAGALVGAVSLVVVYLVITRFSVRLPIRPFFAVTSAVLMYMAFSFAGKGVAELQESNLLSTTLVGWPTTQSLALQTAIVGLIVAGLIWTFVVQPRISPNPARAVRR